MSDKPTLLSRLGRWFHRDSGNDLPLLNGDGSGRALAPPEPQPRSTFLRPWARRDAAISQLQEGFHTLTELMSSVRDSLERQGQRQDELLRYLSHLPQALQSLPENSRAQTEALQAIHQHMEQQASQQRRVADVLERLGQAGREHREAMDSLRDNVEALHHHDEAISQNLNSVGTAMQSLSRNSQTGTQVLESLRDNLQSRDGQLHSLLHKHSVRFTTMLAVAIFLSIAALVTVAVFGYLLLKAQ